MPDREDNNFLQEKNKKIIDIEFSDDENNFEHDNDSDREREEFNTELYDRKTLEIILEEMRNYISENHLNISQFLTETKLEIFLSKLF